MRLRTAFLWLLLLTSTAPADPSWWAAQGVKTTAPAANLSPATIGQAKHIAAMALAELDGHLDAPAYQALHDDVAAIVDLTLPDPLPSDFYDQQRAVLLTGQLKAIAKPFYDHLRTHDAAWLDNAMIAGNLVVMEPGSNPPTPSPYPWTEATADDANRAPATLGQLKAVFSLPLETHFVDITTDTDGDGMSDEWEILHGFDPNDPSDATADTDNDGINNLMEFQLGLSPNSVDVVGPLNFGFDEEITDSPDLSFRPENPSDLYHADSVQHWRAAIGQHIEIWDEGDGNPYAELQSDWDAKGIEQEFDMLPGTRLTFILRYKGRYDGYNDSNPFFLKVDGAHEVLVNGQPAQTQGSVKQASFMADDEWEKYADWHHASITITADPQATTLVPLTLTLIPDSTDEAITYGGFVNLIPVEVTVVFGEGPGNGAVELEHTTSKENLENFLETVKVSKHENFWIIKGKNDRLCGIEIGSDEATLIRALSPPGQTVLFDGHANFGLGPNFSKSTHKAIGSFTNFGTGVTDLPIDFRGDGSEPDIMPYINGQIPWPIGEEALLLLPIKKKIAGEGWAFLVPAASDINGTITNHPIPHMAGRWKFESEYGVSAGSLLEKQGSGLGEYHFMTTSPSKRLIVSAPGTDLPPLHYKTFFYNACSTGPHFIENFDHAEFVYTNRSCAVFEATRWYLKGLIEEKTTAEILHILNSENADGDVNEDNITYEVKNF